MRHQHYCLGAAAVLVALMATPARAVDYYCNNTADFSAALNNASLSTNDTITLNAANTFTAPAGGFILPYKSGSGWITIRSSNLASLPVEERVFPSDAANMPNIVAPNLAGPGLDAPAIKTAAGNPAPHHYKLVGLEIIGPADNSVLDEAGLVQIGLNSSVQDSDAETPNNIILDRCYLHDNSSTQVVRRLVEVHGISIDITNSYLSGCKDNEQEAQAVWGNNGRGPINIINNYIEGSSMSVFFGGVANHIANMTPTDIEIRRNHFFKPLAWKTTSWWVKNHFELKCGQDVVVDGNLFENCWADVGQQYGASIVLKCIQGAGTNGSPWFVTDNVAITNNIVRNVGLGVVMAGSKGPTGANSLGQPSNVTIQNNLFYDVNTTDGNSGRVFQTGSGSPNVTIDHNTAFHSRQLIFAGDGQIDHPDFVFTNNMSMRSTGSAPGIQGSGVFEGEGVLDNYYPGAMYQKNVQMGGILTSYSPNYLGGWDLPPFNNASLAFPTSWSGVLQNQASPGTDFSGYKVVGWNQPTNTSLYPYNNTGTDGNDIGCDIDELNTATAGCITGVWSTPPTGTLLEDFANSNDYWGQAYTGLTADDLITGGKLLLLTSGSSGATVSSGYHKQGGENVANTGVWTTGDFSGQGITRLTFTLKNNGSNTLTAANFPGTSYYFSMSFKRYSTAGNLASNRATWTLPNLLFNDPGRTQILPGESLTVNVAFNSVDGWYATGISNQHGFDLAADRFILAGFRFHLPSGTGVKDLEIDDIQLLP